MKRILQANNNDKKRIGINPILYVSLFLIVCFITKVNEKYAKSMIQGSENYELLQGLTFRS